MIVTIHVGDPFGGAGTTGFVADRLGRHATLIELNPEYAALARDRINADAPMFGAAEIRTADRLAPVTGCSWTFPPQTAPGASASGDFLAEGAS